MIEAERSGRIGVVVAVIWLVACQATPTTAPSAGSRATPSVAPSSFSTGAPTALRSPAPTLDCDPNVPGCVPTGPLQSAHVTRIVDGDTVHVDIGGKDYRLRYIGMDTPESVKPGTPIEPFALAAKSANADLVADQDVMLEKDISETDRFGRLLRYVWIRDSDRWTMVDLVLVEDGLAVASAFPPDVKYRRLFEDAEAEARSEQIGMWAPASPTP